MRIIPAIDIIDGKCVRLSQGDYAQKKIYNEHPLEVARKFEDAGLQHLHLVDLDGAKAGSVTNWQTVKDIAAHTALQIDFGGGIKKSEEIQKLLDLGVAQVNVGSVAVKQPVLVYQWLEKFGPEKIVLSMDVKSEKIQVSGWQENSGIGIREFIENFIDHHIMYVACTDISTDGMLAGPNLSLYKKLITLFPRVKWIASGGVSALSDIEVLQKTGVDGVIVGKAIYENRISLKELIKK